MSGFGKSVTQPGRRHVLGLGLAACVVLALEGCQTANQAYEYDTLIGKEDRLAPWVLPDKGKGIVLQFLPFSGVPVNTADAIYRSIRANAESEHVSLALRLDEPATYRIRTIINAVGLSNVSTFVFAVEIFDVSGKRVFRFAGQEYGGGPSGDPWSGIDGDTERHLAERILIGIKAWITRRD